MTVHFHVGKTPFTFTIRKQEDQGELEEKTAALIWYALRFPIGGERARYTLRRWAGGRG